MKKLSSFIILFAAFSSLGNTLQAQDSELAIRQAITQFASAADANDVQAMDKLLHDSYRIVWPQADKEPMIVPRKLYLEKIGSKEWGGDNRHVKIEWIKTSGAHATALVVLQGKATFHSLLDLVKVKEHWLVTQDAVEML